MELNKVADVDCCDADCSGAGNDDTSLNDVKITPLSELISLAELFDVFAEFCEVDSVADCDGLIVFVEELSGCSARLAN